MESDAYVSLIIAGTAIMLNLVLVSAFFRKKMGGSNEKRRRHGITSTQKMARPPATLTNMDQLCILWHRDQIDAILSRGLTKPL